MAKQSKSKTSVEQSDHQPSVQTESDQKFVAMVKKRVTRAARRLTQWMEEAREDYRFALGDQWDDSDKATLTEQGRPAMTFNKIEVQINAISGNQRANKTRIRVDPEGGEDTSVSEIGDRIMSHVDKVGYLGHKLNSQFDEGIITGRCWIEMARSYDADPLYGELKFRNAGPYCVLKDPDSEEYDLSDAEHVIKLSWQSKDRLKAIFPKKKSVIDSLGADTFDGKSILSGINIDTDTTDYGKLKKGTGSVPSQSSLYDDSGETDIEYRKYWLIEHWYRKRILKWFVWDYKRDQLERFDSKGDAELFLSTSTAELQSKMMFAQDQQDSTMAEHFNMAMTALNIIEREVPQMWYSAIVADALIVNEISPFEPRYSGYPFFQFLAFNRDHAPEERLRVKGLVRNLKDPQRELNKSRSQFLHIINTSANSGWLGDETALSPEQWKELEQFGSKPGITIKKREGKQLDRIQPVAPSFAHQYMEKVSSENLKEISGINADLLAIEDKTVSGRALAARIKQALTIIEPVIENWRLTKQLIGNAIFDLIPEMFDAKKLLKVLGQSFMEAHQMDEAKLHVFLQMVEDRKYNVAIHEPMDTPTLRAETFEFLAEMAKAGVPIPPSLLVRFANFPNQKEVIQEIEAYQQQQLAAKKGQARVA